MRRWRWGACGAAMIAAMSGASAFAATNEEAREEVAGLDPAALYPRALPPKLEDADVDFESKGAAFSVTWDRGCCADDEGTRIGYIALSRAGKKQLKRDLEFSRARGFRPRKVTVGDRTVWYLCGHVCGYEFTRGRYSYGVFGIYYAESERSVEKDMRRVLKALESVDDPAA
jgi:hypothetical protein